MNPLCGFLSLAIHSKAVAKLSSRKVLTVFVGTQINTETLPAPRLMQDLIIPFRAGTSPYGSVNLPFFGRNVYKILPSLDII